MLRGRYLYIFNRHSFIDCILKLTSYCFTLAVLDVKMGAFASALRDMWLEYIEAVPAEFASREAELLLDYLSACLWEQQNRKTREEITIPDFITLRRSTVCVMPLFVSFNQYHEPFVFFPPLIG